MRALLSISRIGNMSNATDGATTRQPVSSTITEGASATVSVRPGWALAAFIGPFGWVIQLS